MAFSSAVRSPSDPTCSAPRSSPSATSTRSAPRLAPTASPNIPEYGTVTEGRRVPRAARDESLCERKAQHRVPGAVAGARRQRRPRRRVDGAEARLAHRIVNDERRAGAVEARLRGRSRRRSDAGTGAAPDSPTAGVSCSGKRAFPPSSRRRSSRCEAAASGGVLAHARTCFCRPRAREDLFSNVKQVPRPSE